MRGGAMSMRSTGGVLVLGISFSHNASIAVASSRGIEFALQEERVARLKNFTGFPDKAYATMRKILSVDDSGTIEMVVFPTAELQEFHFFIDSGDFPDGRYFERYAGIVRN